VVSLINSCQEYFTTKLLLRENYPHSDVQKQNCVWLRDGLLLLIISTLVLHVQCRRLEDAQLVHSVAVNSGFRNSGITVGKTGKTIAVRSTHGLEVPLSHQGKLLVEREYVDFLTQIANQKMEENLRRIQRFYENLQSALSTEKLQKLQIPDPPGSHERHDPPHMLETENEDRKESDVYKRRRKREQHQTNCCHGDVDNSVTELDDCLDLFL
uniref:tRNA wybutosine-synthesizing protein 3 homolog n=1 Tax=Amphiprion percula TaxID=161767 RepID=A0A3P8SMN2_AMPPE